MLNCKLKLMKTKQPMRFHYFGTSRFYSVFATLLIAPKQQYSLLIFKNIAFIKWPSNNLKGFLFLVLGLCVYKLTDNQGTVSLPVTANYEFNSTLAQAILTVSTNTWTGLYSIEWNDMNNWSSGIVPTSASDVIISPGTPYQPCIKSADALANSITLNSGATLTMQGGYNLTITGGGFFENDGSTFNTAASTGAVVFSGTATIKGTSATAFNNITINGDITLSTAPAITGDFTINSGQVLSNSPTYSNTSTLVYNPGNGNTYSSTKEWYGGGAGTIVSGSGIPQNVTIQSGTVTLNTGGVSNRALAGNLNIKAGTTFQLANGTNPNLYILGNWINNSGTFIANGKRVTFDGITVTQTVSGNTTFFDLTLNNPGATTDFNSTTITINDEFRVTAGTMKGNASTFIFAGSVCALEGTGSKNFYNLQINSGTTLADLTASAGNTHIANSFTNNGIFNQTTSHTTFFDKSNAAETFTGAGATSFGSLTIGDGSGASLATILNSSADFNITGGSLTFFHNSVYNGNSNTATFSSAAATVSGAGTANFYNASTNVSLNLGNSISTINNNLRINPGGSIITNAPLYGNTATLIYNTTNVSYNTGIEWTNNTGYTGAGAPYNISITNSNSVILQGDRTVPGILNLTDGSLDINSKTLTVNGGFTGMAGYLKGSMTSNLIAGGMGTMNFAPNDFVNNNITNNYLKTLVIKNNAYLIIGDSLNIAGISMLSPGTVTVNSGSTLNTGGFLTLKSDANGTAMIGESSGTIGGDVTVERFIPYRRAWRFLTTPVTTSQTLNQAWQEGAVNTNVAMQADPYPGYGTDITYYQGSSSLGYDENITNNPSIKTWVNGYWYTPPTTGIQLNDYSAYCIFVRGSRAVNLLQGVYAMPQDYTVLRAKGTLKENGQPFILNYTGAPGNWVLIGNPYAASIDLVNGSDGTSIIAGNREGASGFNVNQFWVWDPHISGTNNVGGYVAYNDGIQVPIDGLTDQTYTGGTVIQSGQAFILHLINASTSATVEFRQADKKPTETNVFNRPAIEQATAHPAIYTNLMLALGDSLQLTDGVGVGFGDNYSSAADVQDALKLVNFDENIALMRNNEKLVIELRPFPVLSDTLFYSLIAAPKSYALKIFSHDLPNALQAWLIDKYLNMRTAVNLYDTTLYSFTANIDTNSYKDRFMLVYNKKFIATPVPVARVINQSTPGITDSAKSITEEVNGISVYPNPVKPGEKVTLQFSNMKEGRYRVAVANTSGNVLTEKTIEYGKSKTWPLQIHAEWAAGIYIVKITGEEGNSFITKLIISK